MTLGIILTDSDCLFLIAVPFRNSFIISIIDRIYKDAFINKILNLTSFKFSLKTYAKQIIT